MRLLKPLVAWAAVAGGWTVLAAGPLTTPVASAALVPQFNCQSMQSESDSVNAPVILSGCKRPHVTGGGGAVSVVGIGPYPIQWSTGKDLGLQCAVACGAPPSGFRTPSRCTNPLTREFDWVGSVATSTGPWTKRFIGETVTFDVCLTSNFGIDGLVPGTLFTIARP